MLQLMLIPESCNLEGPILMLFVITGRYKYSVCDVTLVLL